MPQENPQVSVVIPSWDAAALLEKTLPSALSQAGVAYEVIVVDNGSPRRDTVELVERLQKNNPHLRIVEMAAQAGYTGAVNAGVKASRADLVAVLGNDNIVEPNWLASLVKIFQEKTFTPTGRTIGAVMSQTIVAGGEPAGPCTLNHFGRNIFFADPTWPSKTISTFYPGGNAFLFDKNSFGPPFEDFYFAYHEDVSLGWRVRIQGFEVLESAAPRVQSFDGGSTKRKSVRHQSLVLTERNRWINLLTFPEWHTLLRLLPLLKLDSIFAFCFGKNRRAKFEAWLWLTCHLIFIWKLRARRQAERKVSDQVVMAELSYHYFSTANSDRGARSLAKNFVNFLVYAYMRLLFIPGRRHP